MINFLSFNIIKKSSLATILCAAILLLAQGCGQSKVDYKRVELVQGNSTSLGDTTQTNTTNVNSTNTNPGGDGNNSNNNGGADGTDNNIKKPLIPSETPPPRLDPEAHPPLKKDVHIGIGHYTMMDFDNLELWQKWFTPKERTQKLNLLETNGLGDKFDNTPVTWDEKSYTLSSFSIDRCVFRNRLLEKLSSSQGQEMEDQEKQLPPPFGNLKLFCVKTTTGIKSKVNLAISKDDDELTIRWVGTSAVKLAPRKGKQSVEFKLTGRVADGTILPETAQSLLNDGYDKLINVSMPDTDATNCGLERTYFLKIDLEDGALVGARMIVKSRHLSKAQLSEFSQVSGYASPVLYWHTDSRIPPINVGAINSCQSQHAAWAYCSPDSLIDGASKAKCDPEVNSLLEKNFSDLLGAETPGFATNKVLTYTRSQANGEAGIGNLQLWHDPEARGTNQIKYNPLSIEDFQEFTDIIELVP